MPSLKPKVITSESTHWYLPDGSPYYTVPRSDGLGDRPATLADARKVGAVPSVTAVTGIIAKPQLANYHEKEVFSATVSMEWGPNDDKETLFNKVKHTSRQKGRDAADRGESLHASLEEYVQTGKALDEQWTRHCENALESMILAGFNPQKADTEHSFTHARGFGGKLDYSQPAIIADYKTKDRIEDGKTYHYPEHAMQLSAYRAGLCFKYVYPIEDFACYNIFVGASDSKVLIHKWSEEELEVAYKKFLCLLEYWQLDRNYFPGNINEN